MSDRINGLGVGPQAPGLPRAERPHQHIYLARRKSDCTHWQVIAMNWIRFEAVMFDYKNPKAEPVTEPFDNLDFVDKQEIPGTGPAIVIARG